MCGQLDAAERDRGPGARHYGRPSVRNDYIFMHEVLDKRELSVVKYSDATPARRFVSVYVSGRSSITCNVEKQVVSRGVYTLGFTLACVGFPSKFGVGWNCSSPKFRLRVKQCAFNH
jgi:hypothetical protein